MPPRPELLRETNCSSVVGGAALPSKSRDDIDLLNVQVSTIMEKISDGSLAGSSNPMKGNPEAIAAVKKGAIVYHHRSKLFMVVLLAIVAWTFVTAPSVAYAAACLVIMFFAVDFYGAVLHVVLDHPAFVNYPIIGDGCLEFQWHHAIPQDIVSKPFTEVCGDLNLVALLHLSWLVAVNGGLSNSAANVMAGSKLIMAYTGQWAHRMAHTAEAKRPQWVRTAQAVGLLVSPAMHKEHHTTYNDAFPILNGLTAPLIAALVKAVPNKHVWLLAFVVLSLGDVWLLEKFLSAAVNSITPL